MRGGAYDHIFGHGGSAKGEVVNYSQQIEYLPVALVSYWRGVGKGI